MDKYVELFCKQNPEMKLKCQNPECDKEFKVRSKEVFSVKEYRHNCQYCNKESVFETTKFADSFKEQLKKLGVKL